MTAKYTTKLMNRQAIQAHVDGLEAKVTERDATITALQDQLVKRTTELEKELWQLRSNLAGRDKHEFLLQYRLDEANRTISQLRADHNACADEKFELEEALRSS